MLPPYCCAKKNANVPTEQCCRYWSQTFWQKKVYFIMEVLLINSFFHKETFSKFVSNTWDIKKDIIFFLYLFVQQCTLIGLLKQQQHTCTYIQPKVFTKAHIVRAQSVHTRICQFPRSLSEEHVSIQSYKELNKEVFEGIDSKRAVSGKDRDESKALPLSVRSRQGGNGVKEMNCTARTSRRHIWKCIKFIGVVKMREGRKEGEKGTKDRNQS